MDLSGKTPFPKDHLSNPEASVRIIIRGVPWQGGYGFGYVSDMYPSPFWYVSDSLFDTENTEKDPLNVHQTQRCTWRTFANVSLRCPPLRCQSRDPPNPYLEGFSERSGAKIWGAPSAEPTSTDPTPHSRPSDFESLEVSNRRSQFATIRIAIGSQRFKIARFESQPQNPFDSLWCLYYFFHMTLFRFFKSRDSIR